MTTLLHIWQTHYHSDFAAGVRLLTEHNPGAVTRAILARLQTLAATGDYVGRYEQGKLEYALHNTSIEAPPAPPGRGGDAPAPGVPGVASTTTAATSVITEAMSTTPHPPNGGAGGGLTSDLARTLHKEHAHVHALMVAATTDEERLKYACDIMLRIMPALDAEYDRLRAEASPNVRPAETADDEAIGRPILNNTDARAFKKLQSVRSRISTLRKKIAAEKDPGKKAKWEHELEAKIAERERLENELS